MEKLKERAKSEMKKYMLLEFRRGKFIFIYESGMRARLAAAVEGTPAKAVASAYLPDKWFIFPLWSESWHGGVASLANAEGRKLWGTIYEINAEQLKELDSATAQLDYKRISLDAVRTMDDQPFMDHVYAYVVEDHKKESFRPSRDYLSSIREAAVRNGMPQEYIAEIDTMTSEFYSDEGQERHISMHRR